jgi:hypothetical protein
MSLNWQNIGHKIYIITQASPGRCAFKHRNSRREIQRVPRLKAGQRCSFFVHTGSAGGLRSPDPSAFPQIYPFHKVIVPQQDSGMPIRGRR